MVKIYAKRQEGDELRDCGIRDERSSYDAIMRELKELPLDTAGAFEIYAESDDGEDCSWAWKDGPGYLIETQWFGEEAFYSYQPF